jgi:hypothetical protein
MILRRLVTLIIVGCGVKNQVRSMDVGDIDYILQGDDEAFSSQPEGAAALGSDNYTAGSEQLRALPDALRIHREVNQRGIGIN